MTDRYESIRKALDDDRALLDEIRESIGGGPYDTIAKRIRALLAERDALARDAERYRWLREQTPCTIRLDGNLRALGLPDGVAPAYLQADTADALDTQIDAAIDQARRKENGNG